MDLPAGEARDRFIMLGIVRGVLRYEALNSIAGVRAAVEEGSHSVHFSPRPIVIDLAVTRLISGHQFTIPLEKNAIPQFREVNNLAFLDAWRISFV